MRVVQSRCLKCGSVFASARKRVSYCTCCFADETYLKPLTEAASEAGVCSPQPLGERPDVPPEPTAAQA